MQLNTPEFFIPGCFLQNKRVLKHTLVSLFFFGMFL